MSTEKGEPLMDYLHQSALNSVPLLRKAYELPVAAFAERES